MSSGTITERLRGVGILVAVLALLSGCASAPALPSSPSSDPSSAPRLLVRLGLTGDFWPVRPIQHVAEYLTDGTVVWLHDGVLQGDRLTATGLATVHATLAGAADLLATPLSIKPRVSHVPADSSGEMPTEISEPLNFFVLERPDGSRYTVIAPDRPPVAGDPAPDPTVEGLTALGSALADPATLVGPGGLAGPWETYQPARIAVFLTLETANPDVLDNAAVPRVGPTDWPFTGSPDTFGAAYIGPGSTSVTRRCALVPGAAASTAIASLAKLGYPTTGEPAGKQIAAGFIWIGPTLLWVAGSQLTFVSFEAEALMPEDGAVSCIDAFSY